MKITILSKAVSAAASVFAVASVVGAGVKGF